MIKNMTKGNPAKLIILFSLPMLLGNVFQQFYNLVDSAVVGKCVGTQALAAVGSTTSAVFLITGFAAGVATGFSVVMSQRFGAGDNAGLRRAYAMTLLISAIMSAVLTYVSLRYTRRLLVLMRTPEDIIEDASLYIGIVFAGLFATIFYNVLSGAMRALGDSVSPLIFLIVCSLLNVGLDLLFVIYFKMGVKGVAWATVISQLVSAIMCLIRLAAVKELRLKPGDFIPDFKIIFQILKIGPWDFRCPLPQSELWQFR